MRSWRLAAGSPPTGAPAPSSVDPATSIEGVPTQVLLRGDLFELSIKIDFNDDMAEAHRDFTAHLDEHGLLGVGYVDGQTLACSTWVHR